MSSMLLGAASCAPSPSVFSHVKLAAPSAPTKPKRIVSLDYCTDQFVLKLADRDQIAGLSPDADQVFSYMRDAASGLAKVRASAEDVLAKQPDLIVRLYGGGPNAADMFERAGLAVVQLGSAENLAGVRANIRQMAKAFGHADRGEALIADMDARLQAAGAHPTHLRTLYMTQGGVVAGTDTPVDEMLHAAGLENFTRRDGWGPIPLESLAYQQPDLVAGAFFGDEAKPGAAWSAARHPVAQRQLKERPSVLLAGAATSCGGWFVIDAIEALSQRAAEAVRQKEFERARGGAP